MGRFIRNFKGIKRRKFTHFPLVTNSYRTDYEMIKDEIAELRFMGRKMAPRQRERPEGCPGNVVGVHIRQMLVSGRPAWREKCVEGSRLCMATIQVANYVHRSGKVNVITENKIK